MAVVATCRVPAAPGTPTAVPTQRVIVPPYLGSADAMAVWVMVNLPIGEQLNVTPEPGSGVFLARLSV